MSDESMGEVYYSESFVTKLVADKSARIAELEEEAMLRAQELVDDRARIANLEALLREASDTMLNDRVDYKLAELINYVLGTDR